MDSRARRPTGIERRDFLKGCAAVGIGALAGAGAHGFLYERHHVELTRATLPASGWAEGLAGLRIGFLTDLHRSETGTREISARAVDLLMQERPDLIVLGGDYVTQADPAYVTPAAEVLSGLSAPGRSVRGPRESRRRPRHGRGVERDGRHGAARCPHPDPRPRRAAGPRRHPLLDPPHRGHRQTPARRLPERRTARAHPQAPDRSGDPGHSSGHQRPHPRRPDRHARARPDRGARVPGHCRSPASARTPRSSSAAASARSTFRCA